MGTPSVGGVGGDGGSVYVQCVQGASLAAYTQFNRKFMAQPGDRHRRECLHTADGKDLYLSVPPGTEIRSGNQNPGIANNELLSDMNVEGDVFKLASGGQGGCVTNRFNPSKGERKHVYLELKMIADAALTGFPNAGKSSLLRAMSRAIPKVGDYPFTTIRPMIGAVMYNDGSQVKVADLPGLIEGAHANRGMGHRFLRHIERTKVVVLVVDINGFQLKADEPLRSPLEMIVCLLKELALYQDVILNRSMMLLFNKIDTRGAEGRFHHTMEQLRKLDEHHELLHDCEHSHVILERAKEFCDNKMNNVYQVSAQNLTGLTKVKQDLHRMLIDNIRE